MTSGVHLWLSIRFDELEVNLSADEVSHYAPDVVADMTTHAVKAFTEAISEMRAHGIIGDSAEDEDVEDDDE